MLKLTMVGAALTCLSTIALAQTVVISPEEETETRTFVTREHFRGYDLPAGDEIRVGRELPPEVELREVPRVPRYRAALVGGRTVLVEPGTRRVIRVIER